MKKFIKALICIFILLFVLMIFLGNIKNKNEINTVEIWWYEYENEQAYNSIISNIVNVIVYNSNAKGISTKEVKYSYKDIPYSDYVFKRNIALSTKNAFTIDDSKSLYSLQKYHDDYNKIENYTKDNYFDIFKGKYCVPMGVYSECVLVNKDIFDYYDIDVSSNKLYIYSEFLDLRQRLKEEGARFRLSKQEYYYTIDYYIDKNKLNSADLLNPHDMAEEEYRQLLKKTILEIYNDFNSYYNEKFNYDMLMGNNDEVSVEMNDNEIYDTTSKQVLMSTYAIFPFNTVDYNKASSDFSNKIPVLIDNYYARCKLKTPCIFIYRRNHDENVYKIASELLTDAYYNIMSPPNNYGGNNIYYLPALRSPIITKKLGVDDNFINNTYMANFAKLGYKKIAEQVNLMNTVTSNIMSDAKSQEQHITSFSRGGSIEYLYEFIIEELNNLLDGGENTEKLNNNVYKYTKNYYIRIK